MIGNSGKGLIAQQLAQNGRNGDTSIAHLTPGEVVVPKEVAALRPDIVKAVQEQIMAMGGQNPGKIVVGKGIRNPQTGLEEFASEAEVRAAYAALNREADAGGFDWWLNSYTGNNFAADFAAGARANGENFDQSRFQSALNPVQQVQQPQAQIPQSQQFQQLPGQLTQQQAAALQTNENPYDAGQSQGLIQQGINQGSSQVSGGATASPAAAVRTTDMPAQAFDDLAKAQEFYLNPVQKDYGVQYDGKGLTLDEINRAYRQVLKREADVGGLQFYDTQNNLSYADLLMKLQGDAAKDFASRGQEVLTNRNGYVDLFDYANDDPGARQYNIEQQRKYQKIGRDEELYGDPNTQNGYEAYGIANRRYNTSVSKSLYGVEYDNKGPTLDLINDAYLQVFGNRADKAGLDYYDKSNKSLEQILSELKSSPERQQMLEGVRDRDVSFGRPQSGGVISDAVITDYMSPIERQREIVRAYNEKYGGFIGDQEGVKRFLSGQSDYLNPAVTKPVGVMKFMPNGVGGPEFVKRVQDAFTTDFLSAGLMQQTPEDGEYRYYASLIPREGRVRPGTEWVGPSIGIFDREGKFVGNATDNVTGLDPVSYRRAVQDWYSSLSAEDKKKAQPKFFEELGFQPSIVAKGGGEKYLNKIENLDYRNPQVYSGTAETKIGEQLRSSPEFFARQKNLSGLDFQNLQRNLGIAKMTYLEGFLNYDAIAASDNPAQAMQDALTALSKDKEVMEFIRGFHQKSYTKFGVDDPEQSDNIFKNPRQKEQYTPLAFTPGEKQFSGAKNAAQQGLIQSQLAATQAPAQPTAPSYNFDLINKLATGRISDAERPAAQAELLKAVREGDTETLNKMYGDDYGSSLKFLQDLGIDRGSKDAQRILPASPTGYSGAWKFDPVYGSEYYGMYLENLADQLGIDKSVVRRTAGDAAANLFYNQDPNRVTYIDNPDYLRQITFNTLKNAGIDPASERGQAILADAADKGKLINDSLFSQSNSSGFIGQKIVKPVANAVLDNVNLFLKPIGLEEYAPQVAGAAVGALTGGAGAPAFLAAAAGGAAASSLPSLAEGNLEAGIKNGLKGGVIGAASYGIADGLITFGQGLWNGMSGQAALEAATKRLGRMGVEAINKAGELLGANGQVIGNVAEVLPNIQLAQNGTTMTDVPTGVLEPVAVGAPAIQTADKILAGAIGGGIAGGLSRSPLEIQIDGVGSTGEVEKGTLPDETITAKRDPQPGIVGAIVNPPPSIPTVEADIPPDLKPSPDDPSNPENKDRATGTAPSGGTGSNRGAVDTVKTVIKGGTLVGTLVGGGGGGGGGSGGGGGGGGSGVTQDTDEMLAKAFGFAGAGASALRLDRNRGKAARLNLNKALGEGAEAKYITDGLIARFVNGR